MDINTVRTVCLVSSYQQHALGLAVTNDSLCAVIPKWTGVIHALLLKWKCWHISLPVSTRVFVSPLMSVPSQHHGGLTHTNDMHDNIWQLRTTLQLYCCRASNTEEKERRNATQEDFGFTGTLIPSALYLSIMVSWGTYCVSTSHSALPNHFTMGARKSLFF